MLWICCGCAVLWRVPGTLGPDGGFLLCASLELVLGEVTWLLALLGSCCGPASPHLRALHAALKAYEAQRTAADAAAARAEALQQRMEDAEER